MSRTQTLISIVLALLSAGAFAGELSVSGTPGARVRVDGEPVGVLPLARTLQLDEGDHDLELSLSGYRTHRRVVTVADDGLLELDLTLQPLSWRTAAAASCVLAGAGQFYSGRPKTGVAFLGLQLATAVTAVMLESEYKQRRDDYQAAHLAYSQAIDPEEIAALRRDVDRRWNELDDLKPMRDAFVYSIFAVGLVAAVEAWWNFPDLQLRAAPAGDGVQLGVGGSF